MTTKLEALMAAAEEHKKSMEEKGKEAVIELLKEFLKEHPMIVGIHWKQYIPYFNDGEPCYFRVNDPTFAFENPKLFVQGDMLEEQESTDWDGNDYYDTYSMKSGPVQDACEQMGKALYNYESILEFAFGEHSEIYATPKGIKVEEYCSHD